MRVRLNGPSHNEQPYRKYQRANKHGSCYKKYEHLLSEEEQEKNTNVV